MAAKQNVGNQAPDGSQYVTLTDGAGNLGGGAAASAVTQSGTWTVQPGNTANTTAWLVTPKKSTTATRGPNVVSSATSVTILAANANRLGASVHNDSTQILYLNTVGDTASTSNYNVPLAPNTHYEVPFNYTGIITGIWASANGNARVVEYT